MLSMGGNRYSDNRCSDKFSPVMMYGF